MADSLMERSNEEEAFVFFFIKIVSKTPSNKVFSHVLVMYCLQRDHLVPFKPRDNDG